MALTNTISSAFLHPLYGRESNVTKPYYERLQTTGSATTNGSFNIFDAATSSDDFILDHLSLTFVAASGSSEAILYCGTDDIMSIPTMTAGTPQTYNLNFNGGLVCGTTTTGTVSVVVSIASVTCNFVGLGYRLIA